MTLTCFGYGWAEAEAICVPMYEIPRRAYYYGGLGTARILRALAVAFRDNTVVIHNALFDLFVMAYKYGIDVFAGVIDSGYRGDIGVILYNSQYNDYNVEKGDRIAQLVLQKVENFELVEVSDLNNTDRSEAGFGSTGA